MKEYKLTERDYSDIFSGAHKNWLDRSDRNSSYFHVKCILESFLAFMYTNHLIVKDGKIYETQNEQNEK